MPASRRLVSVAHAEESARNRLPRVVYHNIKGGNEAESTVADNLQAFREITFRPRAAVRHPERRLQTTVLGSRLSMPLAIAPTGMVHVAYPRAEVLAARAASAAGIALSVSTMSGCPIEEVTAASQGPVWYQLYFVGGRAGAESAIDRAARAGCTALLVTVDTAIPQACEAVLRLGGMPRALDFATCLRFAGQAAARPRWAWGFLRDRGRFAVPNARLSADGPPMTPTEASMSYRQHPPSWSDLAWIKDRFPGKLVVKGILSVDDARRAVDEGADAIVVSNHGGFTLDGAPASVRMLPAIAAAVGRHAEVLMDGGVRRGSDVVKAVALGARAVLIGRAYVWGLAAAGERGVADVLEVLRGGIDRTLALLGCEDVANLDGRYVNVPHRWDAESASNRGMRCEDGY
jgi:isopentenyl diphosphate isomerase/L-lactate dehydrogenase-like FMN-dependent dehydrogenase